MLEIHKQGTCFRLSENLLDNDRDAEECINDGLYLVRLLKLDFADAANEEHSALERLYFPLR